MEEKKEGRKTGKCAGGLERRLGVGEEKMGTGAVWSARGPCKVSSSGPQTAGLHLRLGPG